MTFGADWEVFGPVGNYNDWPNLLLIIVDISKFQFPVRIGTQSYKNTIKY